MAEPAGILETGRPGLRFFAVFGPRHAAVASTPLPWRTATERYDEQAGTTTSALRDDAATVRRVAADLTAELATHESQRRSVAASWSGSSADAAHAALSSAGASAEGLARWLADVAEALEGCAEQVEQLVTDKADHVGALRSDRVAGTTPEQLDDLVAVARAEPGDAGVDDTIRGLAPWFADRGAEHLARLPEPVAESRARAVELAEGYLRGRVVPAVQATWDDFDRVCRRADDGVRTALSDLADVLERSPAGPVAPAAVLDAQHPGTTGPGRDSLRLDPAVHGPGHAGIGDGSGAGGTAPAGPDTPAAVSAQAAHGMGHGVADPGSAAADATGPSSGATLAGVDAGGGGPSGAVLAGVGVGAGGAVDAAWTGSGAVAGAWPWQDLLAVPPERDSERFSLADLLALVRDVVLERR